MSPGGVGGGGEYRGATGFIERFHPQVHAGLPRYHFLSGFGESVNHRVHGYPRVLGSPDAGEATEREKGLATALPGSSV